jgi:hypothetical protein
MFTCVPPLWRCTIQIPKDTGTITIIIIHFFRIIIITIIIQLFAIIIRRYMVQLLRKRRKINYQKIIQVHNLLSEILKTEKLRRPKVFSWRSSAHQSSRLGQRCPDATHAQPTPHRSVTSRGSKLGL